MKKLAAYYTEAFLGHETGAHPERPERLTVCLEHLKACGALDGENVFEPQAATMADICRVHDAAYVKALKAFCLSGGGLLGLDTVVSARSFEAAMLAAGAGIGAAAAVADGKARHALALVRPPGHHALSRRAMGFCLLNNVAIAAKHLLDVRGVERVAVLDFDCHHGNGTEDALGGDERAFFMSFHRHPFYPGTGGPDSAAPANVLNVPVSHGTPPAEYLEAWRKLLAEKVEPFEPGAVLTSAGFDGYEGDPVGGAGLSADDFRALGAITGEFAARATGTGVASVLEGGYDLEALPLCLAAYLEGLGAI